VKAEVFDKVLALATPNYQKFLNDRGVEYVFSDKKFYVIGNNSERPARIEVSTLKAIADLFALDFEKMEDAKPVAVVQSPTLVEVISSQSDNYYQRTTFIHCEAPAGDRNFTFNQFMPQEQFLISLSACFLEIGDREAVVRAISSLASHENLEIEDNGFAQNATAKTGVTLSSHIAITPRVKLTPWRTFREADQPESEFILRVKKAQDGTPHAALFEADGGAWKVQAVRYVASWLEANCADGLLIVS